LPQDIEVGKLTLYQSCGGKADRETLRSVLRMHGGPIGITKSRRLRDAAHSVNAIEPPCETR